MFGIDFQAAGRTELAEGVVLAELTAREAERVRSNHAHFSGALSTPMFRLEVFVEADPSREGTMAEARVKQVLQLLACSANIVPLWMSIPIDRFSVDRGCWVRSSLRDVAGGCRVANLWGRHSAIASFFGYHDYSPDAYWRVNATQLARWSALIQNWPLPSREKRIDVALDYLAQAVVDLLVDERRAVLSAAISFEALFGQKAPEIRHRTSQRVAQLLSQGAEAVHLYAKAKTWYEARSKLVHAGVAPEPHITTEFVTHLRASVPAMLRLTKLAGGHERALEALDAACFEAPPELVTIRTATKDAWWAFALAPLSGQPPDSPGYPRPWREPEGLAG